ncbi:MAG: AAA family ATPase [Patescibacteria group bacterium]|nr:AAA family ATPase [Patescibacteria group bacterium]
MKENFFQFFKKKLTNFGKAIFNLLIFFPYFFSVITLIKTLFFPWKNLVSKKNIRGFSFDEWLNRFAFNLISRAIGFFMRFSIISFYFLITILYLLFLPLIFLGYLCFIPFSYLIYLFEKTPQEKKELFKKKFIEEHLLKKENFFWVEEWFEEYYQKFIFHQQWWSLTNLMSYPPIARDWAIGYTPQLDQYVDDLTSSSYQARIKTAHNREKEITYIERVLSKSAEANVLIVGEEGVGKHTIIDSLAKRIYEGKVNSLLAYKRVLKLNMEKLLSITTDQKQRETLLEELLEEACQAKNIILVIDNFDKYVSLGPDRVDLTVSLEKYAKTSLVQIIGITNPFFYQKFIYHNEKISRLFEKIDVYEIKKEEAEKILFDKTYYFENFYKLTIPYETIGETIEKSNFFITAIPFPEKAIDLLDSVCVYAKENKIKVVKPEIVDKILMEKTHIPVSLTAEMKEKLLNLETLLLSQIVQQEEAIKKLASALRRSFLLIGKRKKPLASFLFLGPTGVGKTETAKTIAQVFFSSLSINTNDNLNYLIRFDMSNFQTKNDIEKLIGSITDNNPGLLTTAIRKNPYGVLLLDEIEKAHPDILNIFLTILDEGYFTDGFGKRVDCKNLLIIATSNAGANYLWEKLSFEKENQSITNFYQSLINYLIENHIFSPEFLNRFDDIVIYQPLSSSSVLTIAKKLVNKINQDINKLYKVKLIVSDVFLTNLINNCYDKKFGARNIERVIREQIEDKVAKMILEEKAKEGDVINL